MCLWRKVLIPKQLHQKKQGIKRKLHPQELQHKRYNAEKRIISMDGSNSRIPRTLDVFVSISRISNTPPRLPKAPGPKARKPKAKP
mmetsp:Transcript_3894/g.5957  ORF Transcript_3894/g.5957 Transcript_3894/m.5957 type:complete len:86 (-) Transcript_3894:74-331(-)